MNDNEQYTVYKLTLANGTEMEVVSDKKDVKEICRDIGNVEWCLVNTLLVNSETGNTDVVDVAVRTEYIVSMQKVD